MVDWKRVRTLGGLALLGALLVLSAFEDPNKPIFGDDAISQAFKPVAPILGALILGYVLLALLFPKKPPH